MSNCAFPACLSHLGLAHQANKNETLFLLLAWKENLLILHNWTTFFEACFISSVGMCSLYPVWSSSQLLLTNHIAHRTGLTEVMGLNPVEALNFFQALFQLHKLEIHCNDPLSLSYYTSAVHM